MLNIQTSFVLISLAFMVGAVYLRTPLLRPVLLRVAKLQLALR